MPETINQTASSQTIGGVFSVRSHAKSAVRALLNLGILKDDIIETVTINDTLRKGKILVTVYNVLNPVPVIEIFDKHEADCNLDGSRNFRQDVAGLTVGAAVGAAAGSIAGTALAGPVGTTTGATAGAIIGGGVGAIAGKVGEHNK